MTEVFQKLFPGAYVSRLLEQGVRADGRSVDQVRTLQVTPYPNPDSLCTSTLCTLGRTRVLCRVECEVTSSYPVLPRVELASAGIPHLSQLLGLLLRPGYESELVIREGVCCWVIKCTALVMDDDGSVLDCALHGFADALARIELPTDLIIGGEGATAAGAQVRIKSLDKMQRLSVRRNVRALSFCLLGNGSDVCIADPTAREQAVLESSLSLLLAASETKGEEEDEVVALVKLGKCGRVTPRVLDACLASAAAARRTQS